MLKLLGILVFAFETVAVQFTDPSTVTDVGNGTFNILDSGSQFDQPSVEETLFIPGDNALGPYDTIIPDRFDCSNYTMAFGLPDALNPLKLELRIGISPEFDQKGKSECTIYWDDELTDAVEVTKTKTQIHIYLKYGIYDVAMTCLYKNNYQTCPNRGNACVTDINFLDDDYTHFDKPMQFLATEPILLDSYMELLSVSYTPIIHWSVTKVAVKTFEIFLNFSQPNTSVLRLEKEVLDPGDYVVSLEVICEAKPFKWVTDALVIRVVLPKLVTHITGGERLDVPYGAEIMINASISRDTAANISSVSAIPLIAYWSFSHFQTISYEPEFSHFIHTFPDSSLSTLLDTYTNHVINNGTDYALVIDTSLFPNNSYALVMFTLTRGDRHSSAMQAIRFISDPVPISIECTYNCQIGYRMFNQDKVEIDTNVDSSVDATTLTFQWYVEVWKSTIISSGDVPHVNPVYPPTGYNTGSFALTDGSLVEGERYRIYVIVSGGGYAPTYIYLYRTVNLLPHTGNCILKQLNVTSARDWLTLTCANWVGNNDRPARNGPFENPVLTFTVRQRTAGALVEEEPILRTRSHKSHLILKVGSPDTFASTLTVEVGDVFKNNAIIVIPVTSMPAFNYVAVSPNEAGADVVRSYTLVDYPFDEEQLRKMGKSDLMISLVAAVCSNLHIIDLPLWAPPVPRVLNEGGSVLDLNPSGNTQLGLDDAINDADNDTVDPATMAIQDVMNRMIDRVVGIVEGDLKINQKGDKYLASIISNALTNIAAKEQYINQDSKVGLIQLVDQVGTEALVIPEDNIEDLSAQLEITSGEVFYMARAMVGSAVPDNLRDIRPVEDLAAGREQINQMLSIIGGNMNLDAATLGPDDRAYLYTRMQKVLRFKNRDKKRVAKESAKLAINMAQQVQDKIKVCKTCDNEGSANTKQLVKKNNASIIHKSTPSTETSLFRLDGLLNTLNSSSKSSLPISVSAFEFPENAFMYDEDGTSSFVTSNVLRLDIKASESRVTPGYITFDQTVPTPDATTFDPQEYYDPEDASEFTYHKVIYGKNTDNVCLIIKPLGNYDFKSYEVYFKFSDPPSILKYDFSIIIRKSDKWQYCVTPGQMKGHIGIAYFAVSVKGSVKETNYNMTVVTVGCLTWGEMEAKWHSDKCELEWIPNYNKITCFCKEVTDLIFANSFFVAPNTIDFSSVFLKFSPLSQAAVMGAIGSALVMYLVAVIFLAGLDRADHLKWGITPLRDNYMTDDHYYLIKVFTGMRRGAGTKSRIAFIMTGTSHSTGPRELFDGVREGFSTGSVMTFFMATVRDLGDLHHLYIWHDNSGEGDCQSWYLNQIIVYDITRNDTYTFVAERWLSLDTSVDANLLATESNKTIEFESRFFYQTRDRLSESHMWVSILYRPSISTFTRVQRASCALVYIFLTMIANAMFYNPSTNYQSPPLVQVGPIRFTPQQIYISIVCALITTPPVMLLVFLFKRTKRKPTRTPCCKCCCTAMLCCKRNTIGQRYEDHLRSKLISEDVPDFSGGIYLPWWCVGFAWLLVLAGTGVPAFFIMLYSMEWGKQKSEEWLTAFLMSLLESMLFVDPIMVVFIAFLLACVVRSSRKDTNIDINVVVNNYKTSMGKHETGMNSVTTILQHLTSDISSYMSKPRVAFPPLQGKRLDRAMRDHQHQTELGRILWNLILNVFLIFLIFSIAFGSRDDRSYKLHEETIHHIVNPTKLPHFKTIKTPGELFKWLNVSVIPNLFPETDDNGSPLHWYFKQFTSEYHTLRLGPPRLRQLRAKKDLCEIPYIGLTTCYGEYTMLDEEEADHCIAWLPQPCPLEEGIYNVSGPSWTFTSALDIWGLPVPAFYKTYGGGGYVAQFDVSRSISVQVINELFTGLWLDRQTRGVFFEYTLYSPETNMFIYHVFVVEFPETGGALTFYSVYPIRLYNHVGAVGSYVLFCEVIFILYLIILMIKLCIRVYQQRCKFFSQFWQVYELVMFAIGVTSVALYAIKLGATYLTIQKYKADYKQFVNFAHIVFWDQLFITCLAFLTFMATMRVLEVFASSNKVSAIVKIFEDCGKDLFWQGMSFLYILLGFSCMGYILFGKQLLSYMDVFESLTTLALALVGKSTYSDITATQPILAQIFFMLYVLTVVFFVLSIFLSILGASIDKVIHDTREDQRQDLIEHLMTKLKVLFIKPKTSKKQTHVDELNNEKRKETFSFLYTAMDPYVEVPIVLTAMPPVQHSITSSQLEARINMKQVYRKRPMKKGPLLSE